MTDHPRLLRAAYKAERSASRKLAAASGIGAEQALTITLKNVAGAAGLDALLAAREAAFAQEEARRDGRAQRRQLSQAQRKRLQEGVPTPWRAWFDGSAHPNPGRCSIGALLLGPAGQRIEIAQAAGYGNSSEAEYLAMIAVLEAALRAGASGLTVYGDSRVVIDDINGSEEQGAATLGPLRKQAQALLQAIRKTGDITVRWLPRHRNQEADALSQRMVGWAPVPTGAEAKEK